MPRLQMQKVHDHFRREPCYVRASAAWRGPTTFLQLLTRSMRAFYPKEDTEAPFNDYLEKLLLTADE